MTAPSFGSCPAPHHETARVLLAHGSGGRLGHELVADVFLPALGNPVLSRLEDQALVPDGDRRLAITTDAFVVDPLFFPGGDIGKLAVCGTINDLAVGGVRARFLTASFILEEGLPIADLRRVVASMAETCATACVTIVAADTKVVPRGKADGMFITTTGIGWVEGPTLSIADARPGDAILVSGPIGDHGIVILAARGELGLGVPLRSDCAPLGELCRRVLDVASPRCMRDPTRGGVSATVSEIATASRVGMRLWERALPIRSPVRGACELLGLDPLYIANEGKLVAIVPHDRAQAALEAMRRHPLGEGAAIIGEVVAEHPGVVVLESIVGGLRVVPMLEGEQLPRIC
jgi:hydrogenase expression/formation protein HypE